MRRTLSLLLIITLTALAIVAAPSATAQDATIDLVAREQDGARFFQLASGGDPNPSFRVPAGGSVTLRLTNGGALDHNFHVGAPVDRETPCCQAPGESATLTFTVPADAPATIPYWCVLHRASGMQGEIRVESSGQVPTLRVLHPAEGATVPPDFTIRVEAANASLAEGGRHLHYVIDGDATRAGADTTNETYAVRGLAEGYHLLRVEIVESDHSPLDPPIAVERVVFVSLTAPPEPATPTNTPTPDGNGSDDGDDGSDTPGAPIGLVALAIALVAALRRRSA